MKLTFLGTTAMVPTKTRNHPGILLSYKNENILFDCGENIQRQLAYLNFSSAKLTKVLMTHWHGDHSLGIPGLIQSMSAHHFSGNLEIYGPQKSKLFMNKILDSFLLKEKINFTVKEVKGKFFENNDFILEAFSMKHTAPCLAYSFIEKKRRKINLEYLKKFNLEKHPLLGELQKGKDVIYRGEKIRAKEGTYIIPEKKITYITDTIINKNCIKAAQNADLLICESTFTSELKEKAKEYFHLTSVQAAEIAKKAKVKTLILTHFSQRYKNVSQFKKEAKKIFKNVLLAKDFMSLEL